MINLIKNELIKIAHKKFIYILSIIVLVVLFCSVNFEKNYINNDNQIYLENDYNYYKNNLENYDLSSREEAVLYAEDLSMLQTLEFLKKYDSKSPEYYYIDTEVNGALNQLNYAKYVTKISDDISNYQIIYENMLNKLNNFNWKNDLIEEREQYRKQIIEIENAMNISGVDTLTLEKEIKLLQINIKAINYRIDYEIPYAYTDTSQLIDDYLSSANNYFSVKNKEKMYKNRDELLQSREILSKYKISEYKLENKMIYDGTKNELGELIISLFKYVDTIILLVIIIISGAIIADEFNKGTIKQLLIKPYSRVEILTSKIIAAILFLFLFLIFYYMVNIFAYCYLYDDFSIIFGNTIVYNFDTNKVEIINLIVYCLVNFIAIFPQYLIIFLIVLFVGVFSTNVVAAISSGLGVFFLSDVLSYSVSQKIASWIPILCWDFTPYLFGGISANGYATFSKSAFICLVTIILLLIGTYLIFKNKDIKNQ